MPSADSQFVRPHRAISLLPQAVDVWRLKFNELIEELGIFESWLSDDEIDKAKRFHFEKDRERYILGRGALRTLLARYLQGRPDEVSISYSEYGKPHLSAPAGDQNINFNVAHSHNMAIFAFARDVAVGVDIERERPLKEMRLIARRFFAPVEFGEWEGVDEASKEHAFYLTWTRKEAFIKAIGEGLSYPLDRFLVSVEPSLAARLISIDGDSLAAQDWTLHHLQVGPGYSAALVVAGGGYAIRYWHYTRDWMVNQSDSV